MQMLSAARERGREWKGECLNQLFRRQIFRVVKTSEGMSTKWIGKAAMGSLK